MELPPNDPREINRNPGTENIRAYYEFIVQQVTPDYLRYFRTSGLRVSRDFVEHEFSDYISENKKTKATTLVLKQWKEEKRNPLHALHGLRSAVLSLGNGQPAPIIDGVQPKLASTEGYYHGCSGDVTHILSPDGRYQFYVLCSRMPETDAELTQLHNVEGCGDDWMMEQIQRAAETKTPFFYWIFAVDTQARSSQPTSVPNVKPILALTAPPETTAEVNTHGKRERAAIEPIEEEEEEDLEIEEEVE